MEKTFFSYLPKEIFANVLCYLDTINLDSIVKTFSLGAVKNYDTWKYMLQLSYPKEIMFDIINSKMNEVYTWPDLYQNMLTCYHYIRVIINKDVLEESIYDHYIVLNHRFSMNRITFKDSVRCYFRNNLDTIKGVKFNFLFRFMFYKVFPNEYSILMSYDFTIRWHNLYPNLIAIFREKVDRNIKMSSLWDIFLTDYKENENKWKNYPEMIYLFSILEEKVFE